jgi:cytochrome b pre-mRNA-processing protein 3
LTDSDERVRPAAGGRPEPQDGGAEPPVAASDGWFAGRRRRAARNESAQRLYAAIVQQARHPDFYEDYQVPDTPDGRYDMIIVHAVLVFRRLHREPAAADLAQALFDQMFADFDESLREMGVGDLRVGKQVKALAKGLYGRIVAYGRGLDEDDLPALADALGRNVFRHGGADAGRLLALAGYVRREEHSLAGVDLAALMAGRLAFGAPPAIA